MLDVDVKKGKRGDASLVGLEAARGKLPATYEVSTPSGGWHLYFRYPPTEYLRKSLSTLAPGLDVMAEGGYVIAPPSAYVNGVRAPYTFRTQHPVADLPQWLLEYARSPAPTLEAPTPPKRYPKATQGLLEAARERLRRHGPAVEGEGGDNHTFRASAILLNDFALSDEEAWDLAKQWNETCRPPWEDADLEQKFRNGERYASGDYGHERDAYAAEEAMRAVSLAVPVEVPDGAKFSGTRAFRERISGRPLEELRKGYSDEDVAFFAEQQGCTPQEFRRRWIIQCGSSFWIWIRGRYSTPVPSTSALFCSEVFLAPARLSWSVPLKKGDGDRKKKLSEALDDYGMPALRVEAYLNRQDSHYDPVEGVFHEAVCPIRDDLVPEFNPQIDIWLRMIGGNDVEAFLDWLATVPLLDRPSCALYLCAEKGIGKQLLAEGASHVWTVGGPTELSRVLGNFNEALARCPFVLADEKLPKLPGQQGISGELRSIIASSTRTLNRKHVAHAQLNGCIRLMLAANNEHLLEDRGEHNVTKEDTEAIAERYLFIDARPRSQAIRDYLAQLGGRAGTDAWVKGDGIAKHILWLFHNRPVTLGKRFAVEGRPTRMAQALAWSYGPAAEILQWIISYLAQPSKISAQLGHGVLCGNGVLLVSSTAVAEFWTHYLQGKQPSNTLVGRQLKNLSVAHRAALIKGVQRRYHQINLEQLYAFAEQEGGDVEGMKKKIETPDETWRW